MISPAPPVTALSSGSASAEMLRLGYGARVPALGGMMPSGARGVDAAWYNPAGLAGIDRREIAGSYQAMVENINQGTFGYAQPLNQRFGIAAFVSYLDYGNQDRTILSTAGAFVTANRAGSFSASDLAGGVALGGRVTDLLTAGVALKAIYSRLDNATAAAIAADLGAEYRLATDFPVIFGATVRNLGTRLQYDRVSEDLPVTFQLGATTTLLDGRLGLYAGGERSFDEDLVFRGGVEAKPFGPILALRVGYDGTNDVDNGLTAGLGVTINDFTLDYAYIPFEKFGDNHRVGLTYRF